MARQIFCIRDKDDAYWTNGKKLVIKNCPKPPAKDVIWQAICDETNKQKIDLGISVLRLPEKQWLLWTLSTLNPDHKMFARDYVPAVKMGNARIEVQPLIANPNNFFSNLPSMAAGASRGARGGGLSK